MTRILAVSHTPVWPVRSGSAVRRLMTLEALSTIGRVDLLYIGEVEQLAASVPDDSPVSRVFEVPVPRGKPGTLERLLWSLRPVRPLQMLHWRTTAQTDPSAERYDVVWYFRPVTFDLARRVQAEMTVVDFDDLEDQKLRLAHTSGARRGSMRRRFAERRNVRAWNRYQARIAKQADAVVVCSKNDAAALGTANVYVVPNGFPSVAARSGSSDEQVMLLIGLFDYEPNADAAEFMVNSVLPRIRQVAPDVSLRLVGRPTSRVQRLAGPGVTVVGEVPDLTDEYRHAAMSVAPVRFGGGTRIKILEAFARRVPVVSTTMGAAGLGARHGQDLLIADDERAFADCCVSLLCDRELAGRIADGGWQLHRRLFDQGAVTRAVAEVLSHNTDED